MTIDKRKLMHQIIVLLFMFCFKYLPPFGAMTEFGMGILGIFLGVVYGWLTIGFGFPDLMGIIALGVSGAFETMAACFAATFGDTTTVMIFACIFVCAIISGMNLTAVMVGYLLNLKLAKKNMVLFFIIFFFADWIVSALSTSPLAVILFIELYRGIMKESNMAPYTKINSFILCGIAMFGMMGEISFPFKPVAIVVMGLFNSYTGLTLTFAQYFLFITSYQVILMVVYVLIGKFILRINFNDIKSTKIEKVPATIGQKLALLCIFLMMVAFGLVQTTVPVLPYLGLGGVAICTILIMNMIQVDGQPLFDFQKFAQGFNWGIYLYVAFFLTFVGYVGSADVGLAATIQNIFAPILSKLPTFAFFIVTMLLATVFTNVLNNIPVAVIFISIMYALGTTLTGLSLPAAIICLIMTCFIACAAPTANPGSAIAFGNKDVIKTSMSLKIGSIGCLLLCLFICITYYPLLCVVL